MHLTAGCDLARKLTGNSYRAIPTGALEFIMEQYKSFVTRTRVSLDHVVLCHNRLPFHPARFPHVQLRRPPPSLLELVGAQPPFQRWLLKAAWDRRIVPALLS